MALRPTRVVPAVGMACRVEWLASRELAEVEDVREDGRVVVVAGEAYALHPLTGRYVLAGRPYWDRRVTLLPGG